MVVARQHFVWRLRLHCLLNLVPVSGGYSLWPLVLPQRHPPWPPERWECASRSPSGCRLSLAQETGSPKIQSDRSAPKTHSCSAAPL